MPPMTRAKAAYEALRRREIRAGTWVPRQPSYVVAAHIGKLYEAGMTNRMIAEAAGVSRNTVGEIWRQVFPTVNAMIARAILAVPIVPTVPQPPVGFIHAIGTVRRIQALCADGHSFATQAEQLGRNRQHLADIANGKHRYVAPTVAAHIAAFYARWAHHAPAPDRYVTQARNHAARKGWVGSDAWDDELGDIDNPAAVPYVGVAVEPDYVDPVRVEKVAAGMAPLGQLADHERVALVRQLTAAGWTVSRIAETASASGSTIKALLERLPADEARAAA
jgi:lambda repressor-like predicted transcriptional regulator